MTQAQRLYAAPRRRRMTTLDMLMLGISTCPWRRCAEGLHHLRPGEKLHRGTNRDGLRVYWVGRVS